MSAKTGHTRTEQALPGQPQLQITLSDIAQLAQVQRPVVSMWRSRSKNSDTPFPPAVATHDRQELFDAVEVTTWLAATGRGNNPHAAEDAAAFAAPLGPETKHTHFAGLTALIALRALTDAPLGSQDADVLLDSADEYDPDDEFLFAEIEALGPNLLNLAAYADLLTDASYTASAAFERLLGDRFRTGPPVQANTMLTSAAIELLAATAVELAANSEQDPVFTDDGGSDFLLAVADILGEAAPATLCVGTLASDSARLARRRMRVHGQSKENLQVTNHAGSGHQERAKVRLAQFPSPSFPTSDAVEVLTAIDNISLDMDDQACAVVLAPAPILTDSLQRTTHNREAEAIRSDILRSDRVRAIVRLPRGLLPSRPRQAQALWVLGPAHANVTIADRWTMVADLSGQEMTADVSADLVSDLAASMGSRDHVRAHSFRFAKLVRTRSLLAKQGALTAAAQSPEVSDLPTVAANASTAELIQAESILDALNEDHAAPLHMDLLAETRPALTPTTVGEAITAGSLKYLPGHRLADSHVEPPLPGRAQFRVIGVEELSGELAHESRKVSQLVFANTYPQGRLTEPGDVIFATGAQVGAMVDEAGAAVVLYPARILRISAKNANGLLPAVLAQDLANPPGNWRQCPARRMHDGAKPALSGALAAVAAERRRLAVRLQQLNELSGLLVDGAVHGSFSVLNFGMTTEGTS